MQTQTQYDIAIIGAGIGGAALASILARNGLRVLVLEAQSHPRFAIGESMILETSEMMRATAELFDVPELAYFSSENYRARAGTSHGVKRHFGYLYHRPGQPQQLGESLQAVIPKRPHGHELHLYRQDVDAYLTACAVKYGATVLQNTPVQTIDFDDDGVTITASDKSFRAAYIVDAAGFRSPLAQKFELRDFDLQTHARGLFTHMVGVPCYHETGATQRDYGFPFRMGEGTLHHLFEGGWLWVIPFDNHDKSTNPLVSVGLLLDPRIHPAREGISPEQEFFDFVARYPDMAAQFANARSVRPWTRAGRIQYASKQIVGDRWALLGHAAGFVDPLFSKGLYTTFMSVAVLADLLLDAQADGDYSAARFAPLEQTTQSFIRHNDRLVANCYKSFGNYKLWVPMSVLWLMGAYTEYVKLNTIRAEASDRASYFAEAHKLRLVGGGFDDFERIANQVYALVEAVDPHDEAAVDATVAQIRTLLDDVSWMPLPFRAILAGKNHLPRTKIRLDLFQKKQGFLRDGAYREHFFGNHSMLDIARAFVDETLHYSAPALAVRRRFGLDGAK